FTVVHKWHDRVLHLLYYLQARPPCAALFPYTTLFRSRAGGGAAGDHHGDPAFDRRDRARPGRIAGRSRHDPRLLLCPPMVSTSKDRKSTRLNSSHVKISYAVFCLKKKKTCQTRHCVSL